jgi:DNA-binding NtrC family response regulator
VLIVLIDSEPIVRQTLDSFLTSLGHKMVCMSEASELFDRGDNNSSATDILIVDLNMPRKAAIDTVHKIRETHSDADIVLMSCILPLERALQYGVYSYLSKPIRLEELELLLTRISEKRKLETALWGNKPGCRSRRCDENGLTDS